MIEAHRHTVISYAEYLARERVSEIKHEFVNGVAYAMAGGSLEHSRLGVNLASLIQSSLRGRPCVTFNSDARVRISATGRSTYPDISVVCGQVQNASDDPDAITNPTVIVEILSDSTEASDRGDKFAHYRRLPSLQHYVLVSQSVARVEVFTRQGDSWVLTDAGEGQWLKLESLGAAIAVDDVYRNPLA